MKRLPYLVPGVLASVGGLLIGCEETTRTTVINGVQSGATTIVSALITAIFQSIATSTTTTTTSWIDQAALVVAVIF